MSRDATKRVDPPGQLPAKASAWPRALGSLAIAALVVFVALVGTVAVVVPYRAARQRRVTCLDNLSQLGQMFLVRSVEAEVSQHGISSASLWETLAGDASGLRRSRERLLVCPEDTEIRLPKTEAEIKAAGDIDLAHPPRSRCSYVSRDFAKFPLKAGSKEPEAVAACLHHDGIVIVAWSDGSAQFLKLAELGLDSEEEKVAGPASKAPLLRPLRSWDAPEK